MDNNSSPNMVEENGPKKSCAEIQSNSSFFYRANLKLSQLINQPKYRIGILILLCLCYVIPLVIHYSIISIAISLLATILIYSLFGFYVFVGFRSKRRTLVILSILIIALYSGLLFDHWSTPILTTEHLQIKVSLIEQNDIGESSFFFSISPPSNQIILAKDVIVLVEFNNSLGAETYLDCSIESSGSLEPNSLNWSFTLPEGYSTQEFNFSMAKEDFMKTVTCKNEISSISIDLEQ